MAIGKVPFAEQLATRCKPYFDSLLNAGIEKFDSYIEDLNKKGFSESLSPLLKSIEESDNKTKEQFDGMRAMLRDYIESDIQDIQKKLEGSSKGESSDVEKSVLALENKLDDPVVSGKISVLNLVARLQKDFTEYVNNDKKESNEVKEETDEVAAKSEKDKKKEKEDREATKSTVERNNKKLDKINKKVHENKFFKIMKWILLIAAGGWFFKNVFKPYLWGPIKAELKAAGIDFDKMKTSTDQWLQDTFPQTYSKVKEYFDTVVDLLETLTKKKTKWKAMGEYADNMSWGQILFGSPLYNLYKINQAGNKAVANRDFEKSVTGMSEGGGSRAPRGPEVDFVRSEATVLPVLWSPAATGEASTQELYNQVFESGYTDSETYSHSQFGAASPEHINQLLSQGRIVKDEKASAAWSQWEGAQEAGVASGADANVYQWTDASTYGQHPGDDVSAETGRETYIITTHSAQVVYNMQNESSYVQ